MPRALAASGYAQRVAEISAIEAQIVRVNPPAEAKRYAGLATLTLDAINKTLSLLESDLLKARARHIFSEQARVEQAAFALAQQDMDGLGRLMNDSHQSLKIDYEVSCSELDLITHLSRASGFALGSRMTGAGFGGCAISLVPVIHLEAHHALVSRSYEQQTGITPVLMVSEVAEGAAITACSS